MWAEHNSVCAKYFLYKAPVCCTSYCTLPIPENYNEIQILFLQRSVASRDFQSDFSVIPDFWSFTEQLTYLTWLSGGEIRISRSAIRSEGACTVSGKDVARKPVQNSNCIRFACPFLGLTFTVCICCSWRSSDRWRDRGYRGAKVLSPLCLHISLCI